MGSVGGGCSGGGCGYPGDSNLGKLIIGVHLSDKNPPRHFKFALLGKLCKSSGTSLRTSDDTDTNIGILH